MINKIVAIQGNHPSKLNPETDTSVFLAQEIQKKNYKFYYNKKKFFRILKKKKLSLSKCKFILIRQDPPFNLEYISTTYILDIIKDKVQIINNPTSIRNISEKLYSAKYLKFMPNTIFTSSVHEIKNFIKKSII